MCKLLMIGTGNGGTLDLYNTCFVVQNKNGNFLVDTGGGVEIVKRLNKININYSELYHIFISHSHTDHILGLIWLFKFIGVKIMHNKINEKINIYCNNEVYDSINQICQRTLPKKLYDIIYSNVEFNILNNGDKYCINGIEYTFFDLKAKGEKQFGFTCELKNKKFAFLGDETLNPDLYTKIKDFDYVMHEAFCLDSEEQIFHAYEKNHSTTKSVSEVMNKLNIKNLILYHTEESHKDERQELYTKEAKKYFNGNVIVPNDLEIIDIC